MDLSSRGSLYPRFFLKIEIIKSYHNKKYLFLQRLLLHCPICNGKINTNRYSTYHSCLLYRCYVCGQQYISYNRKGPPGRCGDLDWYTGDRIHEIIYFKNLINYYKQTPFLKITDEDIEFKYDVRCNERDGDFFEEIETPRKLQIEENVEIIL